MHETTDSASRFDLANFRSFCSFSAISYLAIASKGGQDMGAPRSIETLFSVFDLHVAEISTENGETSSRVVFTFDRKSGIKQFRLLSSQLPKDLGDRIGDWLHRNIDEQRIAFGMKSNRIYLRPYRDSFCET